VLLAPLVALALAACTGAKTPAPPPPSPSPPPPTATPVPADPELGRFYRRNGQYQEAIAVYQAVVARAEEPVRQQARLSLALTYMDSERPEEALAELDAYLEPDPPPPGAFQAHFLRARALTALDRLSEAAVLLGLVVHFGGSSLVYLIYAVLVGSFLVSYIRARGEGLGLVMETGLFTRGERVVALALGLVFPVALWPALALIALLSWFTVGERLFSVWQKTARR